MGNTCGVDLSLLPQYVLIQSILVWLPVISLLRFKSVCKFWHALIKSSFFIDLHTTTTATFNSSPKLLLDNFILQAFEYSKFSMDVEKKLFMLSSGSGGGGGGGGKDIDDDKVVFKVNNLGFPPCSKDSLQNGHAILMVGSCNGLICLHDIDLNDVSLYNPATRQFRILPKLITIEEEERVGGATLLNNFVAFGFDVKTKDYKVVWIDCFIPKHAPRGEGCICQVHVYSLCTNSWRLLQGNINLLAMPVTGSFLNHGIYLNGSYFFVGKKFDTSWSCDADGYSIPTSNCSLMFSFDFTKEILTTMQFPDNDSRHKLVLRYFGEKIAAFTIRTSSLSSYPHGRNFDGYDYYDMWVLNEHDNGMNKKSWTKVHSFRIENKSFLTEPMCILNNGAFVLIRAKDENQMWKLVLFNLLTKEVEKDFTIGDGVLRADYYKQSLVSITGGSGAAATSG